MDALNRWGLPWQEDFRSRIGRLMRTENALFSHRRSGARTKPAKSCNRRMPNAAGCENSAGAEGVLVLWQTYPLIAQLSRRARRRAGCMKRGSAKSISANRRTCFLPRSAKRKRKNSQRIATTLSSIRPRRQKNSRPFSGRGISVAGYASIPNVPRSKDTRSTTRARPVQGWARRF